MTRETIEVDVVCVGAGVATLAAALRLLKRARAAGTTPPSVVIFEKGAYPGAHVVSGAVLDTGALDELLEEPERRALPVEARVEHEAFYYLTARRGWRVPWLPGAMRSRGYPIVSLARVTAWLAELCARHGAEIYHDSAAAALVREGGRVVGIRLGDRGRDKSGARKPNFQPGAEVRARAVVLGEGAAGVLTERLVAEDGLAKGAHPPSYALGIKELYTLPARPERAGSILHTFGYPLDYHTYGGGFVYGINATEVAVGLVTALDYRDPRLRPHELFRRFKRHPLVQPLLAGGQVTEYGAKVIPEGGLHAVPELAADGALIVGDGAGLQDSSRLKGIHLAVRSGLAAGDALFACWSAQDWSRAALRRYPELLQASPEWRQMRVVRNVRASFRHGLLPGVWATGAALLTGGRLPPGRPRLEPDHAVLRPLGAAAGEDDTPAPGGRDPTQLDLLSDVYYSGTQHAEDQPGHLVIPHPERCAAECLPRFGAPCTRFCPAQVYELAPERDRIVIQPSNCLHCKTCKIKDPLQNISWELPEIGGPRHKRM